MPPKKGPTVKGRAGVGSASKRVTEAAKRGPKTKALPPLKAKATTKRFESATKKSGLTNILWDPSSSAWQINYPTFDEEGRITGNKSRTFPVSKYLTDGRDESAAEQAALASAQDFRRRLRKNGTMLAKGEATWCRARQRWRAKVTTKNGRVIFGNYFTDKAQAFTEAQELAPAYGVQGPKRLARPRKAASASK
ncbi:unnamed protein product [Durusdinium trenchii]|uniref:AP2/ERF domain-containing protein n=2 Tax=Durusdinium trenchii TaxID=1381693 RepID=A0ABP0S5I0_9DINO